MKKTPKPSFFATTEDNEAFVVWLNNKEHQLLQLRNELTQAHRIQFESAEYHDLTVEEIQKTVKSVSPIPNDINIVQWIHDLDGAIDNIHSLAESFNKPNNDITHPLIDGNVADNFIWSSQKTPNGTCIFRLIHQNLITINQYFDCSFVVSQKALPKSTVRFINYLIKGDNWNSNDLEVGYYKGNKNYTEEDYVNFYTAKTAGLGTFDNTVFIENLRKKYKGLRAAQRAVWRYEGVVSDYVGNDIEVDPMVAFCHYDLFSLGYRPRSHTMEGIGIPVKITNVPSGLEEQAVDMTLRLYNTYGTIMASYTDLMNEVY